jgi:hypothetical protein
MICDIGGLRPGTPARSRMTLLRTSNKTGFQSMKRPTHLAGQVLGCSVYE